MAWSGPVTFVQPPEGGEGGRLGWKSVAGKGTAFEEVLGGGGGVEGGCELEGWRSGLAVLPEPLES